LVRLSRQKMVLTRIAKLRKVIEVNTQKMRGKSLKALEEMFKMAKGFAQSQTLTLPARRKWVQVAAYVAQVINSIASGFDEKEIDIQLDELERLVNEAKAKTKDAGAEEGAPETGTGEPPQGQG